MEGPLIRAVGQLELGLVTYPVYMEVNMKEKFEK